jgi:hypothetical protein
MLAYWTPESDMRLFLGAYMTSYVSSKTVFDFQLIMSVQVTGEFKEFTAPKIDHCCKVSSAMNGSSMVWL